MSLAERLFGCEACGLGLDSDLNAAINLATWAERHHVGADAQVRDPEARGPVTKAHRGDGSGRRIRAGETSSNDVGTQTQTNAA
jgi:putative transposase